MHIKGPENGSHFSTQPIEIEFTPKQLVTTGCDCVLLLLQKVTTITTHMVAIIVYFDWLQLATEI